MLGNIERYNTVVLIYIYADTAHFKCLVIVYIVSLFTSDARAGRLVVSSNISGVPHHFKP